MTVSEEIIKVLDYLAEKFGIVINTTNHNLIPYVKEVCQKIINYEICTSIAWMSMAIIMITITLIAAYKICKYIEDDSDLIILTIGIAAITIFGFICVIIQQTSDIITCITFPEKYLLDYISNFISTHHLS